MATFTNGTKQSAATFSNESANSANPQRHYKAGSDYNYDSHLEYDETTDPISKNAVKYDTIGTLSSFTNQSKS